MVDVGDIVKVSLTRSSDGRSVAYKLSSASFELQ